MMYRLVFQMFTPHTNLLWVVFWIFRGTNIKRNISIGRGIYRFEVAHPNGILFADEFRYLPDGFLYWMLLGGSVGNFISSAHS